MRVAGVSLDDSFLRISVVEKKLGVVKGIAYEEARLPLDEGDRKTVIRETLLKLKEKHSVGAIAVGLSLNGFTHQILEMPLLSRGETRNALSFELEKYLPLSPEEYVSDFFSTGKAHKKNKVIVLSIRKDRITEMLDTFKETGLSVMAVRCSFVEAINSFLSSAVSKNAVFIYSSENLYDVAIIRDAAPVMIRTIPGSADVAAEVEKIKASSGGDIYISGQIVRGVPEKIGAKVFALSIPEAIAATLLKKSEFQLNFIPSEFIPEKKDRYPHAIISLAVFAVIIYFSTAGLSYYRDYSALRAVEKKIEQIKAQSSGLLETRKKMESVYDRRRALNEFIAGKSRDTRVLTELSKILPKDTWLTLLSIDEKGKLEFEGFSRRAASIIEPLSKSGLFRGIEFASPIITQDNMEKFSLKMEITE